MVRLPQMRNCKFVHCGACAVTKCCAREEREPEILAKEGPAWEQMDSWRI